LIPNPVNPDPVNPVPRSHVKRRANRRIVLMTVAAVVGMTGLTWASIPLYRVFCGATGFGGTTQEARGVNQFDLPILKRTMTVRFNTDISPGIPWTFEPPKAPVKIRVGEEKLVYFTAVNNSDKPVTGHAVYNVTPGKMGLYFSKVECFCFTEQTLQPHQSVEMPVQFFIDPQIADDSHLDEVKEVTLSYTFFHSTKAG
jgi:cytochrome c oxidase assembly protein subunit 11